MTAAGDNMKNDFNRAYEKASLQQKKIIDTIEGPVHIIASSGTGIAELLAVRIAGILLNTATLPENILCVTGSDASAKNLEKRLESLMGPNARQVNVKTFKAFCEKVILDNISLIDNRPLQRVTMLESIKLFKQLIDNFPDHHPLKRYRSDVYHEINNLKSLFSLMKKGGLSTELLHQKMDALITEEQEGFQSLSDNEKEEAIGMRLKFRAAINEFDHYQNLLQTESRYDEDDVIYMAVNMLEGNKTLLSRSLQEFHFIHIDAYSEIPGSFNKLLQLLTGFDEKLNILALTYEYPELMVMKEFSIKSNAVFTTNWITLPLINNDRYTTPGSLSQLNENLPVIKIYQTEKEELAAITNQVHELLQHNIPAARIAVVYPTKDYCSRLEGYFNFKNIPFCCSRNIDILKHPFTKKIIQLLRYTSAEQEVPYSGDDLLFEILHFDFFSVPSFEIAKLSVDVNSKRYSKTPTSIRKLIQERANAPAKDLFDTGMDKELKRRSGQLEKLIREAVHLNPAQVFANIVLDVELQHYIDRQQDGPLLRNLLTTLGDFIKQENSRNPQLNLMELIGVIDVMETAKRSLPATIIQGAAKDVYLVSAEEAGDQEFDHVFIAGAHHFKEPTHEWLDDVTVLPGISRHNKPSIDTGKFYHLLIETFAGNKTALYISLASHDEQGKELIPSAVVSETIKRNQLPLNEIYLTEAEWKPYLVLDKSGQQPEIAHLDAAFIAPILKKFVMNVSALNSYLNCPLGFYYKNIIRIPDSKNEALQFGSAVHYALENLFKKMLDGLSVKQFPPVSALINYFKEYMQGNRIHFTKEAFDRRWQYGEKVLANYHSQYINDWNKVVTIERNIRGVSVDNVPLKGKLDKLEFNGKEVNIVDYKSGDIEKALVKMNPPNEVHPNGGDYWRQAVFYKMLIDNYEQKDWRVISTEFDFVEPDKKGSYRKERIVINQADVETVKQQLTRVWQKIQAGDFYTGCGKADCYWCNFVKDNRLAIGMHFRKKETNAH